MSRRSMNEPERDPQITSPSESGSFGLLARWWVWTGDDERLYSRADVRHVATGSMGKPRWLVATWSGYGLWIIMTSN